MSLRKLRKLVRSPGLFLRDYFDARYPRVLTELGCAQDLEPALVERELALEAEQDVRFPIDIVYTWVDGSDPDWQARYTRHVRPLPDDAASEASGTDAARFRSHDEIGWSVRSVLAFLPWVRRIHIVTDRQRPQGLPDDERIRIVDHRELIDARWLPTFNSHVIEAHLHRVPGLAEHFIYFNDDVLVARPLPAGHFFQSNGLASHFVSGKSLSSMRQQGRDTPTLRAALNSCDLLHQRHGVAVDRPLVHTYLPQRRRAYETVWQAHRERIEAFLGNRTRGPEDLNLASFLVPWTAYLEGLASLKTDVCHYFNVRSPVAVSRFTTLLERRRAGCPPHSMCLNDFSAATGANPGYARQLQDFLQAYFGMTLDHPRGDPTRALAGPSTSLDLRT